VQGLLRVMKAYELLTVSAAVNGSREDAIRALMLNPLIADHEAATACFYEMLEAHKVYLTQFFK
jgi:6-phospho-beta-glucosidase